METLLAEMGKYSHILNITSRCSSACQYEIGWICQEDETLEYSKCFEVCGDGVNHGFWFCDDGNNISGDGCSATCGKEAGWTCSNPLGSISTCTPICGDGIVVTPEACDDNNQKGGDG